MSETDRFYGKYRGTVLNNVDPQKMGRILATVPDVSGFSLTSWAMPCFLVLGSQMGLLAVPQIGSGVWIEFEQGNPDYPIWTGCFAGSAADIPAAAQPVVPPVSGFTLQTTLQNSLVVSDLPPSPATGGIVIKSTLGARIVVNDTGIYIDNGKGASLLLVGNTVTINNGALVVV